MCLVHVCRGWQVLPLGGKTVSFNGKNILAKLVFVETSFFHQLAKVMVRIIFPTENQVRNIVLECDCC